MNANVLREIQIEIHTFSLSFEFDCENSFFEVPKKQAECFESSKKTSRVLKNFKKNKRKAGEGGAGSKQKLRERQKKENCQEWLFYQRSF